MGNLTKNLSTSEFSCKCSYDDCNGKLVAHMPLVMAIQKAGDYFSELHQGAKTRINITSGNRCSKHNADEHGSDNSTHIDFIAADHNIEVYLGGDWHLIEPDDLYDYYDKKYFDSCGVGLYSNRVHFDTRNMRARWGVK